MNRNLRTIITDKNGFYIVKYPHTTVYYTFRPSLDLLSREELIKERKLPDGRIKYYIRTNVRK